MAVAILLSLIHKCISPTGQIFYSDKACANNNTSTIIEPEPTPKHTPATPIKYDSPVQENTLSTPHISNADVEIYITSWCQYCKQAMAYFDAQGIAYDSYDIEYDAEAAAIKQRLAPNNSGVPVTVIDGQVINGFSKQQFQRALVQ